MLHTVVLFPAFRALIMVLPQWEMITNHVNVYEPFAMYAQMIFFKTEFPMVYGIG